MPRPKKNTPEGEAATRKWRETMIKRYGSITEQQRKIGSIGGRNGHTGGFASNPELAKIAGAKGGAKSRRGKSYKELWAKVENEALDMYKNGVSLIEISRKFDIPYGVLTHRIRKAKNEVV